MHSINISFESVQKSWFLTVHSAHCTVIRLHGFIYVLNLKMSLGTKVRYVFKMRISIKRDFYLHATHSLINVLAWIYYHRYCCAYFAEDLGAVAATNERTRRCSLREKLYVHGFSSHMNLRSGWHNKSIAKGFRLLNLAAVKELPSFVNFSWYSFTDFFN